MLPERASKIQNWIDWKDWNFLKIWPPRCSFQKLTCLNLEFWLSLLASSQLAFLLLCRSQFIFYFNMSILLALNCQFMQSSFFAMHFLGGCLLCWCPFRAYTTTFYYNTTLTFAGASHKFYAIKIIRYYVFYASFRKCVSFSSPFSNKIYSEKKDAVAEENAYHLCHHFFLISSSFTIFIKFFFRRCCYYHYYYCSDPSMSWRNIGKD